MNKKIIMSIILCSILLISCVNADVTPENDKYLVNSSSGTDFAYMTSMNHKSFYDNVTDRWYVFYCDDGGNYMYFYYSYSDSGDLTTWNKVQIGSGILTNYLAIDDTLLSDNLCFGSLSAVVYDGNNSIGHAVFFSDVAYTIEYINFTIAGNGVLTFGSGLTIYTYPAVTYWNSVDICLSSEGCPIITFTAYSSGSHETFCGISDSIDGYNGNWDFWNYGVASQNRWYLSLIPFEDDTAILFYGDAHSIANAYYNKIEFGVTANDTAFTSFTDSTVFSHDIFPSSSEYVHYGSTYNETHGGFTYMDSVNYDGITFLFDLDTMVKTTEYVSSEDDNYYLGWNSITEDTNEFFVNAYLSSSGSINESIIYTEQHSIYDDFFNTTTASYLLQDFEEESWLYYDSMGMSKHTGRNNISLTFFDYEDDLYVTFAQYEGEYAPVIPPAETPFDYGFYIDSTGWFFIIGFIVIIAIMSLSIKIKNDSKRRY